MECSTTTWPGTIEKGRRINFSRLIIPALVPALQLFSGCIYASEMNLDQSVRSLTSDTKWVFSELTLNATTIKTNGYKLTIIVNGNLNIIGNARIYSFDKPASQPDPKKPVKPARGTPSYDPGPNTPGYMPGANGRTGGGGPAGINGTAGASGKSAGDILIRVKGSASGSLAIVNDGLPGGDGTDGSDGANGGNGEQGGIAIPNRINLLGVSIIAGCAKAPGFGGGGGPGGKAGNSGDAGSGGNGGSVSITVEGEVSRLTLAHGYQRQFFVNASAAAAGAGRPGDPGQPGVGGSGGFGGKGSEGCLGRVTEGRGTDGPSGEEGRFGNTADSGLPGDIQLSPPEISGLPR
jgi:hypothetical protein